MAKTKKQIFLWFGDNDYEISQQTKKWVNAFEKKYSNLNITKFDFIENKGNKNFIIDLKNALQVDSLFGANKFIILKDFLEAKLNIEIEKQNVDALNVLAKKLVVLKPSPAALEEFRGVTVKVEKDMTGKAFSPEAMKLLKSYLKKYRSNVKP